MRRWLDSIRLTHDHEGRDEFFQTHWQRLDQLMASPYMMAEILYLNMKAFGDEGLIYLESMMGAGGFIKPDGTPIPADDVADIYRKRLVQADAKATGVTVRLQESILRFAPNAEQQLVNAYDFVSRNRDLYLAVNMVGREDNDKGHPLRFTKTLRELRQKYNNVRLSVHAGEVDEPNFHIRDTLMLGADRIGHGAGALPRRAGPGVLLRAAARDAGRPAARRQILGRGGARREPAARRPRPGSGSAAPA